MMVDIAVLQELAKCCRRGLQSISNQSGSMFSGFPKGSCGPAAELVGRVMYEVAGYEGLYVCGSGHTKLKPSQTHAWYEIGDYIIDITHDQFPEACLSGWVFNRSFGWHADFVDLDSRSGFCMPNGWPCYPFDGYQAITNNIQNMNF